MKLKPANEYKDWEGPLTCEKFDELLIVNDYIVWYPKLCPLNHQLPSECNHSPMPKDEFKGVKNVNIEPFYIYRFTKLDILINYFSQLDFWNSVLTLIGILIPFILLLFSNSDKSTEGHSKKDSTNVEAVDSAKDKSVFTAKVECGNCPCECEYQDIKAYTNGKVVHFRVVYLSQEKRWKYRSVTELQDGTSLSTILSEKIPLIPGFKEALGIICVGTASQEGNNIRKEEIRAEERADEMLSIIRHNRTSDHKELYKLNLGKYMDDEDLSTSETAYQRRVILIGIINKDRSIDTKEIGDALKKSLNNKALLNYDTERYSNFSFTKVN